MTKMNRKQLTGIFFIFFHLSLSPARAQVYLDESMPLEQRINDALTRMTLDEKIAVIHAQSKFSSPGVKRLGFPDLWTDDGPHGVRSRVPSSSRTSAARTRSATAMMQQPIPTA